MDTLLWAGAFVTGASLLVWVWLVVARGRFWTTGQRLDPEADPASADARDYPAVAVIVPARNEADTLPATLPALLRQEYPGPFTVFLVDDSSADGTAAVARAIADDMLTNGPLTVVSAGPLPEGWAGKVWAMHQGLEASARAETPLILFTDADVLHPPDSLRRLVQKALDDGLDMASLMVLLRAEGPWERLLVPAYVYFFAKLYPFRHVNDPRRSTAAAAGGCVLLRREALAATRGLAPIASEIIDDCALARMVKGRPGRRIWLGLSREVRSVRPYGGLTGVWRLVTRTAFTQLGYSRALLAGTVLGMFVTYLVPPLATAGGTAAVVSGAGSGLGWWLTGAGLGAWLLMAGSYVPMVRWHRVGAAWAFLMPVTAGLYTLMTFDSALRWGRGAGGGWKGRTHGAPEVVVERDRERS